MKRNTFIYFNVLIGFLVCASFALATEAKKTLPAAAVSAPVKQVVRPASPEKFPAANLPVQNNQPTGTASSPLPTMPAKATVPAASPNAPNPTPAPVTSSPQQTYSYHPLGKPDPFKPFIVVETVEKKKSDEKKTQASSIFPLQREETEKYRVVGIAGDQERRVAIVEDAAKKFYPLYKGTRIGVNNGKVMEILNDRVIVEEYEGESEESNSETA